MIQCKKCKAILKEPTLSWQVVFHGNLEKQKGKWELNPWGEDDYINSLTLECDCGYKANVKIEAEDIEHEHLEEVVRKLTGLE